MSDKQLTPEQKNAVDKDGAILIGAAAGSGKTFVLTERIARILNDREHPVSANRMLILTFTNAAASEMRQKIRKKISELIALDPSDDYLRTQQRLLRRTHIGTVHSFCQKILREFFSEAGISPDFSLCDEGYSASVRSSALEEAMDRLCTDDPETAGLLFGNFGRSRSDRETMEAVLGLHGFEQNLVDAGKWEDEVLETMGSGAPFRDSPAGRIVAEMQADRFLQARRLLENAVMLLDSEKASGKGYEYYCALRDHCIGLSQAFAEDDWDKASRLLSNKPEGRATSQKSWSQETVQRAKAAKDIYLKLLDSAGKMVSDDLEASEEARTGQYAVASALIKAERLFRQILTERKRERGLLEYDDLEKLVIGLFYDGEGNLTDIGRSVSDRFDHVMVDEFQDTNERQKMIFDAVSDGGKNLFCVGDVKQSIYSFRRADPSIFTDMRKACRDDGPPSYLALHSNFRSSRGVIEAVNRIFDPLMTSGFGGVDYMPDERLAHGRVDDPEGYDCGLEYHSVDCSTGDLPEVVAGYVAGLLSQSGGKIREENICIMLRSVAGRADKYTEALRKKGIRYSSTASEDFFEASEIMTVMSLLRCISNPGSDVDLAAVMMSPLFGFTADELASLRLQGKKNRLWSQVRGTDDPKCIRLRNMIDELRKKASAMSTDEIVRETIEVSEAEIYLTSPPDTIKRKSRLHALVEYAAEFTSFGGRGLSDFLRYCSDAEKKGNGPDYSESAPGGVIVTSVHKAKGLEWPIVILADAGRALNTSADSSRNVLFDQKVGIASKVKQESDRGLWMEKTPEYGLISEMKLNGAKAEEMRILYVALTRARDKAVVFAARKSSSAGKAPDASITDEASACVTAGRLSPMLVSEKNRYADWIDQALGASGFTVSDFDREEVTRGSIKLVRREAEYYKAQSLKEPEESSAADPELTKRINRRLSFEYEGKGIVQIPTTMTVTQLTESFRPATAHRPAFVRRDGLNAAERGTALHEFMQHCDLRAAAEDPGAEAARLRDRQFLSKEAAASIDADRVRAFFGSRLGKTILEADRVYREYSYMDAAKASDLIQDLDDDHKDDIIIIQGTADCIIEKDGKLTVLDYKTDRVTDPEELRRRYSGQLRSYSKSVAARLGKTVSEAVIWSFWLESEVPISIEQ